MSLMIDKKFVSLVSPKLEHFKQKSEFLWNFRCPVCGDSKKNKMKARGYLYGKKSNIFFTCHNCHTGMSLGNFIKTIDPSLYREYKLERYKNESSGNVPKPDIIVSIAEGSRPVFNTIKLPTIASLDAKHPAKRYLVERKIPDKALEDIYYADDYKAFSNEIAPDSVNKIIYAEPRIVFPFWDKNKKLLGVQGRAIGASKVKYITVKLDENNPKVFGLDKLDFTKKIYVVEGIIDSLFLPNSIALMDASLFKVRTVLGNLDLEYVLVPDRDIRNKEVVKNVEKMIAQKYSVCLLPENFPGKDINEAIISGLTQEEIVSIINENTHEDLRAKLEFSKWQKV
jgi:hypothetical protein